MEHNQQSLTVFESSLPLISKENEASKYVESMSFKKYLSMKDRISSTGLKQIVGKSPYYFKETWLKNLESTEDEDEEKDHFRIGHAVHLFFLEPTEFRRRWVMQPKFRTTKAEKELKKQWHKNLPEDAVVLKEKDLEMILGMAKAVKHNKLLYDIFTRGIAETTFLFQDEITGILCKARPDLFVVHQAGYIDVFDVKTTRSIYGDSFAWDAGKLKYNMQIAFYADAIQNHFKKEIRTMNFIAISKEFPYEPVIKTLSDEEYEKGQHFNRAALDILKKCIDQNYWPQYSNNASMLSLPKTFIFEEVPQFDFEKPKQITETL